MNSNQNYISKALFKLKVYQSDMQRYEDLFSDIMTLSNPNFSNPKPQGRLGDGKCDGYDKTQGKYYQVYAPENLSGNLEKLKPKFENSLKVIIEEWENISSVREFVIVLNDKYKGNYQSVEQLLAYLDKMYNPIKNSLLLAKDLERVFDGLDDDKKYQIIGSIPNVDDLAQIIKFDILKDAIENILKFEASYIIPPLPKTINFPLKIEFNNLSNDIANFINVGSYQIGNLEDYFKQNVENKKILQEILNKMYNDGLKLIPDSESQKSDLVFFYILNICCNSKQKTHQDAVLVLMSYYFGYCDIFEEPPKGTLF